MHKKVLLTSVCRPLGPKYGDAPSVGYELLYGQVTRAQGLFSPRTVNIHYSLEYIAENLDAPTVVLQYPSKRELIRELKKGYDYVGVSFLLAVMHKMKETVALIRQYAPHSKIVLGGYGTVLKDEALKPYGDYICREEGVGFFRRLLGEPEMPMPYKQPLMVSRLKVFGWKVSNTGKIFAGLGCPNGCDFCCTSHFFSRKHIKLLPEGKDIYAVAERYLDLDPNLVFLIMDEDFLLNKKRAMEFRDCVMKGGKTLSIFAFSSVKALSQYTVEEILEMGIDGFWIGYEGTRSGYAKQQGRPIEDILTEFRAHGITILTSMIVGFDYQTPEVVAQELDGLMKLKPSLAQFLIYGPVPGTPFYERVLKENLLHDVYVQEPEQMYRRGDGFATMIKHPTLSPEAIEDLQRWCFERGFPAARPEHLPHAGSPLARLPEAQEFAQSVVAPQSRVLRQRIAGGVPGVPGGQAARPQRRRAPLDWRPGTAPPRRAGPPPRCATALRSVLAVGAALWTGLTLKLDLFQHPKLTRTLYRMPAQRWTGAELWEELRRKTALPNLSIQVELQHAKQQVWLRLEGRPLPRRGRGPGAAHPRFTGAQQEPPGAGPQETPLGQGGRPAAAAREARRLSLAHPADPAQAGGGPSRGDPAGQHVPPL